MEEEDDLDEGDFGEGGFEGEEEEMLAEECEEEDLAHLNSLVQFTVDPEKEVRS